MAEAKKPTKPRAPAVLDQAAAAELLGITEAELVRSRMRGLPPGTLGVRGTDGLLVWKKKDLTAYPNEAGEEGMSLDVIILVVVLVILVVLIIRGR